MRLGVFRRFIPPFFAVLTGAFSCGPEIGSDRIATGQNSLQTGPSSTQSASRHSPSPTPSANADRIEALDREIADIQDTIRVEGDEPMEALDAQMASTQDLITSLSIESEIERSTQADEFRLNEDRQAMAEEATQRDVATLAEQVRAQEQVVAEAREQLRMAVAPEQTDLRRNAESVVASAEQGLAMLQTRYAAAQANLNSSADRTWAAQRDALDGVRSRQADLARTLVDAQREMAELTRQRQRMERTANERTERIRQLRSERAKLEASASGTAAAPGSTNGG